MDTSSLPLSLLSLSLPSHSFPPPQLRRLSSRPRRLRSKPLAAAPKSEQQRATADADDHPPDFYDEEWQARQREKTKDWHAYRQKEEDEENKKANHYREIGMRLKEYPEEEVREARKLVSTFIRAAEEVEVKIEEAAERGELSELVLMVIWNRLDIARHDDEKDVIRSLDLLYRRVEPKGCIELPEDDMLLRVDFVREVDALLQEVRSEQGTLQTPERLDPESVATRLKQQEKQRSIRQVEALLELAISLKW